MNISTYLPQHLLDALERLARERHVSRSAIIREAVETHLERYQRGAWPAEVMNWQGDPDFPPFEATRTADDPHARDPFDTLADT